MKYKFARVDRIVYVRTHDGHPGTRVDYVCQCGLSVPADEWDKHCAAHAFAHAQAIADRERVRYVIRRLIP